MSANRYAQEDAGIPPNVNDFSQAFGGLPISSLINFHLCYDEKMLHKDSGDYMAFRSTQGMYRPSRLLQGATNSVSACVRVSWKLVNAHLVSIVEIFVNDVRVKGPKSWYAEEEVEGLSGVWRSVVKHLQNLDNIFANVERAGGIMSGEKSHWSWNGVKIFWFVCGEAERWPQVSKVNRVWN